MKKILIAFISLLSVTAAQAADLWPFAEVNNRLNVSLNAGYHFDNHVAAMGFGVTIKGIHLTIGGVGTCRLGDGKVPEDKNTASAMIQLGYQIPVVRQFRFIPVVGTAAAGKVIYDTDSQRGPGEAPKTRLKMKYRFDAGVHLVFNYKALIVNAAVTRYTVFGGIGVEF